MSGGRNHEDETSPGDLAEMVTWLENKWVRHGELEDLAAARLIESLADRLADAEDAVNVWRREANEKGSRLDEALRESAKAKSQWLSRSEEFAELQSERDALAKCLADVQHFSSELMRHDSSALQVTAMQLAGLCVDPRKPKS